MKRIISLFACILVSLVSCKDTKDEPAETDNSAAVKPPAVMQYSVVKIYPHDTASFTEGLEWHDDAMYESSGDPDYLGKSGLIKMELETGKILQKINLDKKYFAEGITKLNDKIYQLTYKEHKVFVYDMNFKKIREFEWPYEGWGMTTDGKQLIVDTGGSNIYFINPETFKIERTLGVSNNNGYVDSINELEYVNGYIYANIWLNNSIIKINPKTGIVEARADLSDIYQKNNLTAPVKEGSCLNGIAYDPAKGSFYITGKYWPNVFEVKFN